MLITLEPIFIEVPVLASVMMTTKEINEVVRFLENNKNYDMGIHLTVFSFLNYVN